MPKDASVSGDTWVCWWCCLFWTWFGPSLSACVIVIDFLWGCWCMIPRIETMAAMFFWTCLNIDHGPCTLQIIMFNIGYSRSSTHFGLEHHSPMIFFQHFHIIFPAFSHGKSPWSRWGQNPSITPLLLGRRPLPPPWLWHWSLQPRPWPDGWWIFDFP